MCPRELASQIYSVLVKISESYEQLTCALFVGGTDINDTYSLLEDNGAQVCSKILTPLTSRVDCHWNPWSCSGYF
jgi:superfamily II DNA/RNA helicase